MSKRKGLQRGKAEQTPFGPATDTTTFRNWLGRQLPATTASRLIVANFDKLVANIKAAEAKSKLTVADLRDNPQVRDIMDENQRLAALTNEQAMTISKLERQLREQAQTIGQYQENNRILMHELNTANQRNAKIEDSIRETRSMAGETLLSHSARLDELQRKLDNTEAALEAQRNAVNTINHADSQRISALESENATLRQRNKDDMAAMTEQVRRASAKADTLMEVIIELAKS